MVEEKMRLARNAFCDSYKYDGADYEHLGVLETIRVLSALDPLFDQDEAGPRKGD